MLLLPLLVHGYEYCKELFPHVILYHPTLLFILLRQVRVIQMLLFLWFIQYYSKYYSLTSHTATNGLNSKAITTRLFVYTHTAYANLCYSIEVWAIRMLLPALHHDNTPHKQKKIPVIYQSTIIGIVFIAWFRWYTTSCFFCHYVWIHHIHTSISTISHVW